MQDVWEVKSPIYLAITDENRSLTIISGYVYGRLHRFNQKTFAGTDESRGGGSILTHFLFLPVHLVGSTLSSEPWGLWNNHHTFFFFGSRETEAVLSHCSQQQLHAVCTPAHWGCRWEPITCSVSSPGMRLLYLHAASSPSLCTSSPIIVFAVFWLPHFSLSLRSPSSKSVLSLPLVLLLSGTKALLWNG